MSKSCLNVTKHTVGSCEVFFCGSLNELTQKLHRISDVRPGLHKIEDTSYQPLIWDDVLKRSPIFKHIFSVFGNRGSTSL